MAQEEFYGYRMGAKDEKARIRKILLEKLEAEKLASANRVQLCKEALEQMSPVDDFEKIVSTREALMEHNAEMGAYNYAHQMIMEATQ